MCIQKNTYIQKNLNLHTQNKYYHTEYMYLHITLVQKNVLMYKHIIKVKRHYTYTHIVICTHTQYTCVPKV